MAFRSTFPLARGPPENDPWHRGRVGRLRGAHLSSQGCSGRRKRRRCSWRC